MANRDKYIIHLELKKEDGKNEHSYYSTIKHLTDECAAAGIDIGVSYNRLRCYGIGPGHPYENKKCIIRKGILHAPSSQLRGENIRNLMAKVEQLD